MVGPEDGAGNWTDGGWPARRGDACLPGDVVRDPAFFQRTLPQ